MAYTDLERDLKQYVKQCTGGKVTLNDYPPSPDPGFWRGMTYVLGLIAFVLMIVILFLL